MDRGRRGSPPANRRHLASIVYFDLASGRATELARLDEPSWFGVALSRDRRSLLFSVEDHAVSNLMVVENLGARLIMPPERW